MEAVIKITGGLVQKGDQKPIDMQTNGVSYFDIFQALGVLHKYIAKEITKEAEKEFIDEHKRKPSNRELEKKLDEMIKYHEKLNNYRTGTI